MVSRPIDADTLKKVLSEAIKDAPLYIQATVDQYIDEAPTLTQQNNIPSCYQSDGTDGCAYWCYDGDDEPIDKCKECPLCYPDKQRHNTLLNEVPTWEELESENKFLRAENEKLRKAIEDLSQVVRLAYEQRDTAMKNLSCVTAERDAAKPQEVVEAVDELVEFARTRMSTADWLYYANVIGEWHSQKENKL